MSLPTASAEGPRRPGDCRAGGRLRNSPSIPRESLWQRPRHLGCRYPGQLMCVDRAVRIPFGSPIAFLGPIDSDWTDPIGEVSARRLQDISGQMQVPYSGHERFSIYSVNSNEPICVHAKNDSPSGRAQEDRRSRALGRWRSPDRGTTTFLALGIHSTFP